jgi:hypothetical protein
MPRLRLPRSDKRKTCPRSDKRKTVPNERKTVLDACFLTKIRNPSVGFGRMSCPAYGCLGHLLYLGMLG